MTDSDIKKAMDDIREMKKTINGTCRLCGHPARPGIHAVLLHSGNLLLALLASLHGLSGARVLSRRSLRRSRLAGYRSPFSARSSPVYTKQ
jgi:hypothetical protein